MDVKLRESSLRVRSRAFSPCPPWALHKWFYRNYPHWTHHHRDRQLFSLSWFKYEKEGLWLAGILFGKLTQPFVSFISLYYILVTCTEYSGVKSTWIFQCTWVKYIFRLFFHLKKKFFNGRFRMRTSMICKWNLLIRGLPTLLGWVNCAERQRW